VIADIHFDYRLALESIKNGIHGLRINPGNIGNEERIREVVSAAKEYNIPIRIGVNSGSVEKEMLEKYKGVNSFSLIESALKHVHILERLNFDKIKISVKASEVPLMIDVYRKLADKVNYPLHLGVTEAGSINSGIVKSAVGIGTLLAEGIGDTIRVSLTGNPVNEINVAKDILKSLKLRNDGLEIISCPTCGRCQVNLEKIVLEVEEKTRDYKENIKLAIMGCVVNGPGEAREADLGIAGGIGEGLLFRKGQIIRKVKEEDMVKEILTELELIRREKNESN
jgi:(E)-4-hydroxy-3-methylbut-2-enyl-diphosphate synthase